jgi:hypothetical protein
VGNDLVAYEVALSSIVDFEKGYSRGEWDELWSDWDCEWRHAGGCNWVIYTQQLEDGDKLSVHDPRGDLPKNQDSWVR